MPNTAECWCGGDGDKTRPEFKYGDWRTVWCGCSAGQAAERAYTDRKHERQYRQHLEQAEIPQRFTAATFESYPVSPATAAAVQQIRQWAAMPDDVADDWDAAWQQWWESNRRSLLIYGAYGRGKTGLAVAAFKVYLQHFSESDGLFTTVPDLLDAIRRGYDKDADGEARAFLERVKRVECLVLDDLGAERVTDWVAERLFVVINARHGADLATIFTSNLAPPDLGAHLGERTMWRIIEMADIVRLDGPNLRER